MKEKLNCILLVDDDEPTNFLNSMLLEEAACAQKVQVAQGGQKALNFLTNSGEYSGAGNLFPQPELIFLDINMPAMNGWEFLAKYKELRLEQKGEIIIIMLTTSLNPDDKMKAETNPFIAGFENKPITPEMITRILSTHFRHKI